MLLLQPCVLMLVLLASYMVLDKGMDLDIRRFQEAMLAYAHLERQLLLLLRLGVHHLEAIREVTLWSRGSGQGQERQQHSLAAAATLRGVDKPHHVVMAWNGMDDNGAPRLPRARRRGHDSVATVGAAVQVQVGCSTGRTGHAASNSHGMAWT